MIALIKTLALTVLLTALGFAGFHAGQYLHHNDLSDPAALIAALPSMEREDTRIHAVSPSMGPMPRTVTIEEITGDEDGFSLILNTEDAEEILEGQDVVFHSLVDGRIYPVQGKVQAVENNGDDQKKIRIDAPQNFLDLKPTVQAQIIINESVSKRLPLEALMQADNGDYYVWRALPEPDGTHRIVHQKISVSIIGDDYFGAGPEIQISDLVVANPPANFENGQSADLVVSVLDVPLHSLTEQVRVRESEDKAAKAKAELEMWQALTNTVAQPGGGCGAPLNAKGLPASIESNGAIAGAATSGASTGCSSCATPAAAPSPVPTPDDNAAAPPAVAPSGGCGGCGGSTYGGAPPAAKVDNPVVTQ